MSSPASSHIECMCAWTYTGLGIAISARAFVIEAMDRHCGWLALMAGAAIGACFMFIHEKPGADNWRQDMCEVINEHRDWANPATPVKGKRGAPNTPPSKRTNKKRKVEAEEDDEDDEDMIQIEEELKVDRTPRCDRYVRRV
ncbi:ATP-dependent 6-phosphofructokinase [Apiospora saccharicola]|uniref:6-phosphofructokinase n=1 Tax=Apiospora saccharicola TaxID=335842 RepID=A0ABR1UZN7_9PEZI